MRKLKAIAVGTLKSAGAFSLGAAVTSIAVGQEVRKKQLSPEGEMDVGIFGALLGGSITLATYHALKRR